MNKRTATLTAHLTLKMTTVEFVGMLVKHWLVFQNHHWLVIFCYLKNTLTMRKTKSKVILRAQPQNCLVKSRKENVKYLKISLLTYRLQSASF